MPSSRTTAALFWRSSISRVGSRSAQRDRLHGAERDRPLHRGMHRVRLLEVIAEDHLRHLAHVECLEVEARLLGARRGAAVRAAWRSRSARALVDLRLRDGGGGRGRHRLARGRGDRNGTCAAADGPAGAVALRMLGGSIEQAFSSSRPQSADGSDRRIGDGIGRKASRELCSGAGSGGQSGRP